ncbi:hypothetical protein SIA3lw_00189 [Salmonella phage vB_SalS-SIA3lw]
MKKQNIPFDRAQSSIVLVYSNGELSWEYSQLKYLIKLIGVYKHEKAKYSI